MTHSDSAATEPTDPGAPNLACGAVVDDLLEQVAEGRGTARDGHQRDCVHCQAALDEFARAWEPVIAAVDASITPPPDLVAVVMGRIGTLVKDVWYTLQLTDDGAISVAARVVAVAARNAARRVPGVRVALGRSTQSRLAALVEKATREHRHPHAAVGVLGRTAVIDLALAVTYGDPVHDVAHDVQRQVVMALRETIGLESVIVNVTIDDVLSTD